MRRIFLGTAAGNIAGAACGFLFSVAIARLMDIASFGRASFIFSLVIVISSVADFGFSNSIVIFHNRYPESSPPPLAVANHFFYRFLGVALLACIPVVLALGHFYALKPAELAVIIASFLSFTVYRYCCSLQQAVGNWHRFNRLQVAGNALKLIIGGGGVLFLAHWWQLLSPYGAALGGYLTASILLLAVAVYASRSLLGAAPPTKALHGDFFRILRPMALAGIFVIITMRFDSLVIQKFLGPEALGIYTAANTLAFAFPLITISLMNVLLRESALGGEEVLTRIMAAQKRYLPALLLVFTMAWLLAGILLPLVFGKGYAAAVPVFRLLLIPFLGGVFFTPLESYFYAREPLTILWFKFGQMMVVIIGSLALIGSQGLQGVATAIALSRALGWAIIYTKSRAVLARHLPGPDQHHPEPS
jgi:O-antigen/teichoic acid export membrane protein